MQRNWPAHIKVASLSLLPVIPHAVITQGVVQLKAWHFL